MEPDEPAASALRVASSLTGDRIARVIYREIRYDDGQPGYRASDHHSLDYGPELHLQSGRVVSFIWEWPICYYLGVSVADLSTTLSGEHASWDVSAEAPWPTLLGREIRAAHVEWFRDDQGPGDFPLTTKLVIDANQPLYITLGVGGDPDDHLALLFSEDVAHAYDRFIVASGARRQATR